MSEAREKLVSVVGLALRDLELPPTTTVAQARAYLEALKREGSNEATQKRVAAMIVAMMLATMMSD